MEFSRVGKNTINCLITEDEIQDLGFTVEEIVTNAERTQAFMNQIFELAEREFEIKFEMGVKTVQVEFRSDHTLSLTFSEYPAAEGMMEHLRDIIGGLLSAIPPEKLLGAKGQLAAAGDTDLAKEIFVMLNFAEMDTVIRFAKSIQVTELPKSWLVKEKGAYYLVMELKGYPENEMKRLSLLSDEYASVVEVGEKRWAYLREHGKMVITGNALESLREL